MSAEPTVTTEPVFDIDPISGVKVHRAVALMPPATQEERDRLRQDIAEHGIKVRVKMMETPAGPVLLDGLTRVPVWVEMGRAIADLPTEVVAPVDPAAYVLSLNVVRRQLKPDQVVGIYALVNKLQIAGQQAEAATAQTAGLKRGAESRERTDALTGKTAAKIAKATGVGKRTVEKVLAVQKEAPERLAEVAKGRVSANAVLKKVKQQSKSSQGPITPASAGDKAERVALDEEVMRANSEAVGAGIREMHALLKRHKYQFSEAARWLAELRAHQAQMRAMIEGLEIGQQTAKALERKTKLRPTKPTAEGKLKAVASPPKPGLEPHRALMRP